LLVAHCATRRLWIRRDRNVERDFRNNVGDVAIQFELVSLIAVNNPLMGVYKEWMAQCRIGPKMGLTICSV